VNLPLKNFDSLILDLETKDFAAFAAADLLSVRYLTFRRILELGHATLSAIVLLSAHRSHF